MNKTTTHASDALARLIQQLSDKPNARAILSIIAAEVQAVENALWDLHTLRSVETATGDQLDGIGRIVGEKRKGLTDDFYRVRLQARIALNRGSGNPEEIIKLFQILQDGSVDLEDQYPAGLVLRLGGEVVDGQLYADVLREACPAAVDAIIEFSEVDPALTFSTEDGPGPGFGDATTPATGGEFAGALDA